MPSRSVVAVSRPSKSSTVSRAGCRLSSRIDESLSATACQPAVHRVPTLATAMLMIDRRKWSQHRPNLNLNLIVWVGYGVGCFALDSSTGNALFVACTTGLLSLFGTRATTAYARLGERSTDSPRPLQHPW